MSMLSNWSNNFRHAERIASATLMNFLSSPTCCLISAQQFIWHVQTYLGHTLGIFQVIFEEYYDFVVMISSRWNCLAAYRTVNRQISEDTKIQTMTCSMMIRFNNNSRKPRRTLTNGTPNQNISTSSKLMNCVSRIGIIIANVIGVRTDPASFTDFDRMAKARYSATIIVP